MLKGKRISILGDSISTYKNVSNDINANSTIFGNPYFYCEPFPLEKTYWSLLIEKFGLSLCVNNSWSGGNLSGRNDFDSGINRAKNLSRNDGSKPDIIIVFIGINDLGRNVSYDVFAEDYCETLMRIMLKYPSASVCCVNMPDRDISFRERTEEFNRIIKSAVDSMGDGFFVADLFNSRLNNDDYYNNTLDGLHPDEDGMRMIAEVIAEAFEREINH